MGDVDSLRNSTDRSAASEQAQEHTITSTNRSRSACGCLYPTFSLESLGTVEHVGNLDDPDDQEDISQTYEEVFGEDIESVFEDASPSLTTDDRDEGDEESSNIWPPSASNDQLQDPDPSPWSNNLWSTSPTPPIPLPSPNDLTSTYLPFSSHLALTNHFPPSTLFHFQTLTTPIFLHSTLQLPSTLAQILSLRTSDVLCRLTPSILLDYTTYVSPDTLLPSLHPAATFSIYRHVNGLLYFPSSLDAVTKITEFLAGTHTIRAEMRKVQTQVSDSQGKRHEISAWAWVAETKEGTEEWWTLEDFVSGRVVGLGSVEW